jgi:hypothetical protein
MSRRLLDVSGEFLDSRLCRGDAAEDEAQVGGGPRYGGLEFVQSPLLRGEFGSEPGGPVGRWGRGFPVEDDVVQRPFGLDGFAFGCVRVMG